MTEERDLDAAERALGLDPIPPGETAEEAAARIAWEVRFAPLLTLPAPVEPPFGALEEVERRLGLDHAAMGAEIVEFSSLRRRMRGWRAAALTSMAAAAALALWVATPAEAPRYVAVVTAAEDGRAALIVDIDTGTGAATVVPVGLRAPQGSDYELWRVTPDGSAPISLGVLPRDPSLRRSIAADPGDVFAISLEPAGGSPTGAPTTAPVFTGEVVRVR